MNIPDEIRRVRICRGCCCGKKSRQKDEGQLREKALSLLNESGIQVERTDCLGPCSEGDIVVVLPTASERRQGIRPLWFGRMHSLPFTKLLAQCILDGFPDSLSNYPELERRRIKSPRRKGKGKQ